MSEDPQLPRFMAYLSLFTFFMLILVTSNNFLQLFLGWEGVGLCSYLLIGFWYTRISAAKAAIKAIVLNRIGDCGIILAIFSTFYVFRSLDFAVVFSLAPFFANKTILFFSYEFNAITLICFFLFIGAVGKSAQIGLHTWLPDAMEGPTPVSALIHAATMVTAGVFLIIRCSPLFEYSTTMLIVLAISGSLTSIFAATAGLVQHDIKKIIAYSTCSQLGYMVFCCGLSNYPTSLFHLLNHAFFKALLFLSAGAVIHALANEQDIRKMGGLAKVLPFTYVVMLLGSLALTGFPFLSGFYSKDIILESTIETTLLVRDFVYFTSFLTALLTAIYSFRLIYFVFLAETQTYKRVINNIHEVPPVMAIALSILAFGSLFSGYIFHDALVGLGTDFFETAIFVKPEHISTWVSIEFLSPFLKQTAPLVGIIGSILVIYLLVKEATFITVLKKNFYVLYKFLLNKWYFDNIFSSASKALFNFNYSFFYKLLDKGVFEFFGPFGATKLTYTFTNYYKTSQSGFLWHSLCTMLLFLILAVRFYEHAYLVS
jgi:proton-translocating NADH-quinone oxidoreductase chain L